jgi:hypothetical protein
MILISHRGNINGRMPNLENNPDYIDKAIEKKYDVEVDLRTHNGKIFLGHDAPQYQIDIEWLKSRSGYLWIHGKDRQAFEVCLENDLHTFWHDTDDYTITSKNYVWAYPGKLAVGRFSILVMPERVWSVEEIQKMTCAGLCSDIIEQLII